MASEALSNVVDVKEMRQPDLPEEWQRRCAETTARLKETEGELTMVQKRLTNMGALLETAAGQRTSKMSTLQADVAEERRLRKEAEDKLWAERRRCQDLEGMLSHEHRLRRDAEAAHHGPGELQKLRANLASEKKARAAAEALAKSVAAESRAPRLGTEESARKARKPQLVETAGTPAIHKAPVKATSTATCPVPREDLERLEVRSRILQAENAAMRMEAFQQRARLREQQELHHMAAEEMRIRQLEAQRIARDLEKTKVLLEESQRARQAELSAMVKNMCSSKMPSGVQVHIQRHLPAGAVEVRGRLGGS